MPAEFDICVEKNGQIRTKDLGNNKYRHVCYLGGKAFLGEVKDRKDKSAVNAKEKDHYGRSKFEIDSENMHGPEEIQGIIKGMIKD